MFDIIFPNLDRKKANTCVACELKKKQEAEEKAKNEGKKKGESEEKEESD